VNDPAPRRPGGVLRLAGLLAAAAAFFEVFSIGFPPASRERLPALALAGILALVAAWNRGRGLALFAFLFPLAGLGSRLCGGVDAVAWPVLLFLGMAAGWAFRFLYDFENPEDPSRLDEPLTALTLLWVTATALAVIRARTLWVLLRGLRLRAVNVEGLSDVAAIRTSLLSLAALGGGAAFFYVLRRAGREQRERALVAALAGIAVSALLAVAERLGVGPAETSVYWRQVGRFSGGAADPNALGILCAAGLVVAAVLSAAFSGARRVAAACALAAMAAGLALSGSRSGVGLAAVGLVALLAARSIPPGQRAAVIVAALALAAALGLTRFGGSRGSAGARVAEIFDATVPVELRASTRPLLWHSALREFARNPVEGAGLGAFTWQLPNLLAEEGRKLAARDNPGSGYVQALAETGVIGFVLTLVFAALLARESWASLRGAGPPAEAGAGAAALGFLAALATGSHWLSPDVALFVFLLAAVVARPRALAPARRPAVVRRLALGLYIAAALWSILGTARADEAFRYRPEIGFHDEETGPGGSFRWTQRRFALRLEPGEVERLTLALYTPEGRAVALTAEAEGVVWSRALAPGEAIRLRLAAGREAARVFRFALSRAFVPRRLGTSTDRRELGAVAVLEPRR
jgi:O-antigen ligase